MYCRQYALVSLLCLLCSPWQGPCRTEANVLNKIIGGTLHRLFRRRIESNASRGLTKSADEARIEELLQENEELREQIGLLKRSVNTQKSYAMGLRRDKEALRRLLETSARDTEAILLERFHAEKAEALQSQQQSFAAERKKLKDDLRQVKNELEVASKGLNDATLTIKSIKEKLRKESFRADDAESKADSLLQQIEAGRARTAASRASEKVSPEGVTGGRSDKGEERKLAEAKGGSAARRREKDQEPSSKEGSRQREPVSSIKSSQQYGSSKEKGKLKVPKSGSGSRSTK